MLINQQKTTIVYLSLTTKKTQFYSFLRIVHSVLFIRLDFHKHGNDVYFANFFNDFFAFASFVPWFGVAILFQSFEIWIEIVAVFAHFIDQRLLVVRNISPILLKEIFEVRWRHRSLDYVEKHSKIKTLSWKIENAVFFLTFFCHASKFLHFFLSLAHRVTRLSEFKTIKIGTQQFECGAELNWTVLW